MTNSPYTITKLQPEDLLPFDLLLLADETKEAIEKYIYDCEVYLVNHNGQSIATFALYPINKTEVEIKNIALVRELQGKGIGSDLIKEIVRIVKEQNYSSLIVGTGDVSAAQIRFYEKNGFVKYDMKKNFFLDNYKLPIIENGKQMKDMVMLRMKI
jgi:ribosomal protein S18 acetylase RimI-like enzyme